MEADLYKYAETALWVINAVLLSLLIGMGIGSMIRRGGRDE
jgi:hypothetical protein